MRRISLLIVLLLSSVHLAHGALSFDGTSDIVITTNANGAPTTYPIAFGAVIYLPSGSSSLNFFATFGSNITGSASGYTFQVDYTGGLGFAILNLGTLEGVGSAGVVPLDTWIFLGMSSSSPTTHRFVCYNYATRTVDFNDTNGGNIGAITPPATQVTIGALRDDAPYEHFFPGRLQWLALYNEDLTVLTGARLLAMALHGPYATALTPRLLYTFNESPGTPVRERMKNGTDGTPTTMANSAWIPISLPGPFLFPQ